MFVALCVCSRAKYSCHPTLPATITFTGRHNHPVNSADALRRRDVSPQVHDKFLQLFAAGHSPSSALEVHKCDLQMEDGDSYSIQAADRHLCPDLQWCFRLYYKTFKSEYGPQSGDGMVNTLQKRLTQWNDDSNNSVAYSVHGDETIIGICTPLMKRVHSHIRQSSELVFVDSTGCLDMNSCRVFVLMTNCCAGGLPLGLLVTTSEAESVVAAGLQLLQTLLPDDAFFGRGSAGPFYFMTDDCLAERNALKQVFPTSVTLLCKFHVLWAAWRWLWNNNSGIPASSRTHLYNLIHRAVSAKTGDELAGAFTSLFNDETANMHDRFMDYAKKLVEKSELWSSCYRDDVALRGHSTNNTVESSMRILKDRIFKRLKAFNLIQLIDFLVTRLEQYYERRLTNIANNRLDTVSHSRYLPKDSDIALCNVWKASADVVHVPSASDADVSYCVHTTLWLCTCPAGRSGAPCKHQWAAFTKYRDDCFNFLPVSSPSMRKLFHYIATGKDDMPDSWFAGLKADASESVNSAASSERQIAEPQVQQTVDLTVEPDTDSMAEEVHKTAEDIARMTTMITSKLEQDPGTYLEAAKAMVRNFDCISTTNGLVSAMHCFGKYTGAAPSLTCRRKRKAIAFANKAIGVQPTALARRSVKCYGRAVCGLGRPAKNARSTEHGYGKLRSRTVTAGLPTRKTAAPHCLAECVSRNSSLGK